MTDAFAYSYALLIGVGSCCGGADLCTYPDDMASNIRPEQRSGSLLAVPGLTLELSREEILESIREGRRLA